MLPHVVLSFFTIYASSPVGSEGIPAVRGSQQWRLHQRVAIDE